MKHLLAYDLGTGGVKAALYDQDGACRAEAFTPYKTYYPQFGRHEQKPSEWWQAIIACTRKLISDSSVDSRSICGIGVSGHSLGMVPVDEQGHLLRETAPIWSDTRPSEQELKPFFAAVTEREWYLATGNGFPKKLYTVFKVMWLRNNEPETFPRVSKVIGTKDYINFRLTGQIATDPSYASGSGIYDLRAGTYSSKLLEASGLSAQLFPPILPSTSIIGELNSTAAHDLALPQGIAVVAGGVDNSCMALGAKAFKEGGIYQSLGSSSWIAVTSAEPVLNAAAPTFVFAHVVPGMFSSATSIFSAGSSLRWIRDTMAQNLISEAEQQHRDVYDLMAEKAAASPPGANGLLFNSSLAGSCAVNAGPHIRGSFIGLDLKHTQGDLIRAAMEGIAFGLRRALDALRAVRPVDDEILIVGGGSRSALWRRILADMYNMRVIKTTVDQQAAALGAAALAAVGTGAWNDFERITELHTVEAVADPDPRVVQFYERLREPFELTTCRDAAICGLIRTICNEAPRT